MPKLEIGKYIRFRKFQSKKLRHFIVIPVLMLLVYLLVYITDDKVYAHGMYIPIIYASIFLDFKYSTLTGILGGIILGPLIPFSVQTGEAQETIQWIFRLSMFTSIGFFSGYIINVIRDNSVNIIRLFSLDQATKIPNQNGFKFIRENMDLNSPKTIISFYINNYEALLDIFGIDLYNRLLIKLTKLLKTTFNDMTVIKPNDNKLWLITDELNKDIIVNKIHNLVNKDLTIEDINFFIEYYLGIHTTNSVDEYFSDRAFINADIAARYALKNQLVFADFNLQNTQLQKEFNIISYFQNAILKDELYLDYQPIINLENNSICMFEALIRWKNPRIGNVTPDEFIPLIEQTHLIHSLTNWVIQKVIQKINEFKGQGIYMRFSINISAKNLFDHNFVDNIIDLKNSYNICDNQIELEVTESIELIDNQESHYYLNKLKENGFSIAIDDFGKGYSSISYLYQFPTSKLKIDRYFSQKIQSSPTIIPMVQGLINFAHTMGLEVTFEGIETEDIDATVRSMKSNFAQGYFYSKPLKCEEVISFYKLNNGLITK